MRSAVKRSVFSFPVNPSKIPGIQIWYSGQSAFSDAACTTLQTSNGGAVLGLKDLSGNNNNATQATSGNACLLNASAINGKPSVYPAGTTTKLTLTNPFILGSTYSLYAVAYKASSSSNLTFTGGTTSFETCANFYGGIFYVINSSIQTFSVSYPISNYFAIRVRKTATGNAFVASTGIPEIQVGSNTYVNDSYHVNTLFVNNYGQYSATTSAILDLFILNNDSATNNADIAARSYIQQTYGLSIP